MSTPHVYRLLAPQCMNVHCFEGFDTDHSPQFFFRILEPHPMLSAPCIYKVLAPSAIGAPHVYDITPPHLSALVRVPKMAHRHTRSIFTYIYFV